MLSASSKELIGRKASSRCIAGTQPPSPALFHILHVNLHRLSSIKSFWTSMDQRIHISGDFWQARWQESLLKVSHIHWISLVLEWQSQTNADTSEFVEPQPLIVVIFISRLLFVAGTLAKFLCRSIPKKKAQGRFIGDMCQPFSVSYLTLGRLFSHMRHSSRNITVSFKYPINPDT
jgi:hypothetical protein